MHRLFFAVRPDPATAAAATALTNRLRAALGLTGRPLATQRLHVTLHWLHDHEGLPEDLLARATAAGERLDEAPFDVVFDRVESLGGRAHGGPLVLTGADGLNALRQFQRRLGAAMAEGGIGDFVRPGFLPHLTLQYDDRQVAAQPIPPLRWTVRELLLLDSLVGRSLHLVRGRWPLG